MNKKYNASDCVKLMRDKYDELSRAGDSRYPKRADFSDEQVTAIKAFLGPWPRALEKSGIKPADEQKQAKKVEKRIELKRRKTRRKAEKKSAE